MYSFFLTNRYGFKLKKVPNYLDKKQLRLEYAELLLSKLNISVRVENQNKIPKSGQYLIFSNHRSIIDPLVIDIALKDSGIFGVWIAKKELYNSLFFRNAVRNGGCIRLDRENNQSSMLFTEIKEVLNSGSSISIFPEGTRNKTDQDLLAFKKGFHIIALKNKLPMLPIYIKSNTADTLQEALLNNQNRREITVTIGDPIDYSDKHIKRRYQTMFGLSSDL